MSIKLIKKIVYTGDIKLITGLHIGGSNTALNIGGPDNFVVRNPINKLPYIPGSSLKGKLRSLSEIYNGEVDSGGPTKDKKSKAGQLFGTAGNNDEGHASRLIVRDAELDMSHPEKFTDTDLLYTESKTESNIDRVTSKANPQTIERVPAGAIFKFSMVLNVFEDEDEKGMKATLKQAMKLLEDDYLGGNGSRGYGQIVFENVEKEEKTYPYEMYKDKTN